MKSWKNEVRNQALAELSDIRYELYRMGLSAPPAKKRKEKLPQDKKPNPFDDLRYVRNTVMKNIEDKGDFISALGFWNVGNLLGFTMEQRATICKALVDRAKELGFKPSPVWLGVLDNPAFYEDWAEDITGEVEVSSLSEVRND